MKSFGYRIFVILSCLTLLCAAGCRKSEFTIRFDFPADFTGNYIVTSYAWDDHGGTWLESTASLQEGKAEVPCATVRPTLVYVRDASSPSNSIILYAKRGDKITLSGKTPDMNTWTVTGNKLSEEWSRWRNSLAGKEKQKGIEDYVQKNTASPLSAIMLLTEWNRHKDPKGFISLWNSIANEMRSNEIIELCGTPDFPGVEFKVTAEGTLARAKETKTEKLTLRTRDNGADTLNLAKSPVSLLYFFEDNDSGNDAAMDTLISLAKAYPDSVSRVICDVSAQSDSMTWVFATRRDTIPGAVRAWMPAGLADKDAVRLGVVRLPWFIVTGRDAHEEYSGGDPAKASDAFRKEMRRIALEKKLKKEKSKEKDSKEKDSKKKDSKDKNSKGKNTSKNSR